MPTSREALASHVEVSEDTLSVELVDGRTIAVPLAWYPRLAHSTSEERSCWRMIAGGHPPEVTMGNRRRIFACILGLYLMGLFWGYVRLPWAAVKSLRDYRNIARASAISFDPGLDVSPAQRWYLERALTESPVPVVPRVSVEVKWNALVLARVYSSHYVSSKGAEGRDSLYLCLFGAWLPVYDFGTWMV